MQNLEEKINVSGTMKSLEIGESFSLEKEKYMLSSVKVKATEMRHNFGKVFTVRLNGDEIIVKRVK